MGTVFPRSASWASTRCSEPSSLGQSDPSPPRAVYPTWGGCIRFGISCYSDTLTDTDPEQMERSLLAFLNGQHEQDRWTNMSRTQGLRPHRNKRDSKQSPCSLVDGDKRIEITPEEFESARKDRDELSKQLEIECWFAELRSAVLAWQEKMLRFAARMHSEEARRFVPIQVECELTSRIATVLVATHGLRPYIDGPHRECPRESACVIAHAMRNSWTHVSVRLFGVTTAGDNLYLTGPQIEHMPTNGHRHRVELRVPAKQLLECVHTPPSKTLKPAIAELFPDGDIDAVTVLNSHVACINKSMTAYRARLQVPGAYRDELLAHYGLVKSHFLKVSCGTQEIALGEPFDRMLDDRAQMRERNAEVPVLELVQFGCGEFRIGSLAGARDYILELLVAGDFYSWDTETAADVLDLGGYAREELCNGAPPLFRDAVVRLYERATESASALQWRGWALRVLARRLRPRVVNRAGLGDFEATPHS